MIFRFISSLSSGGTLAIDTLFLRSSPSFARPTMGYSPCSPHAGHRNDLSFLKLPKCLSQEVQRITKKTLCSSVINGAS
ncbi:MAG: hypothetical protein CXX81_22045 [Methanobacteriota archaeon]|nr:MAG: hypothetical protein CXX81_22045 [Euryarchaeota archaeon]